jgi:hypothetical protein
VFAGIAAFAAKRTNDHQAEQLQKLQDAEDRRAEEKRRTHAERFAVWVTIWRDEDYQPGISLVNSNPTPIYKLTLYCCTALGFGVEKLQVVAPTLEGRRTIRSATRRMRQLVVGQNPRTLMDDGLLQVAATFRDTANNWWFRATDGRLESGRDEAAVRHLCEHHLSSLDLTGSSLTDTT